MAQYVVLTGNAYFKDDLKHFSHDSRLAVSVACTDNIQTALELPVKTVGRSFLAIIVPAQIFAMCTLVGADPPPAQKSAARLEDDTKDLAGRSESPLATRYLRPGIQIEVN